MSPKHTVRWRSEILFADFTPRHRGEALPHLPIVQCHMLM